jgi:hypothetical protein
MGFTGALLLALQSAGSPGTLGFDVRCMIALGQMAQSADGETRAAANSASQYYFGRIDSRVPDGELEATLIRETRGMPERLDPQLLQACGTFMAGRGQRLSEVGRRIGEREGQPVRR